MKKLIENIITYVGIGTIITIAVGSYVINLRLSQFHLLDFDLVKPHAISVGLTLLVWLAAHAFILLLLIDLEDLKSNSISKIIFITVSKLLLILSFLFAFLGGYEYLTDPTWTWKILSWQINLGKITLGLAPLCTLTYFLFMSLGWKDKETKKERMLINIHLLFALSAALANFFLFFNTPLYHDLLIFETPVFFLFLSSILTLVVSKRGSNSDLKRSWFSPKNKPSKTIFLTLSFAIFLTLPCTIFILQSYSKNIFQHIPQSFGGGQLEKMIYKTDFQIFKGEKIYQTHENVFLLCGDSIIKLNWSDVREIVSYNQEKTSADNMVPFIIKIK